MKAQLTRTLEYNQDSSQKKVYSHEVYIEKNQSSQFNNPVIH